MEEIDVTTKFEVSSVEAAERAIDALPGAWKWTITGGVVTAWRKVVVDADYDDEENYPALAEAAEAETLAAIVAVVGEPEYFHFAA